MCISSECMYMCMQINGTQRYEQAIYVYVGVLSCVSMCICIAQCCIICTYMYTCLCIL